MPLSSVDVPRRVDHASLALLLVVLPVSFVNTAVCGYLLASPMSHLIEPLPNVNFMRGQPSGSQKEGVGNLIGFLVILEDGDIGCPLLDKVPEFIRDLH